MAINVDIVSPSGNRRAIHSAENIGASTRFGIEKALWRTGKDIRDEFSRQVLSKNKTGRIYIRRDSAGRGRSHQASAAGETPANRTGDYRKSYDFSVDGAHQLTVGNFAEHSGFLEEGTSRMRARPGLDNSIKASERNLLRNLAFEIEDKI